MARGAFRRTCGPEPHRPRPRAYSPAQVRAVAARQGERNALATEIVHASGIRAHELLTLGRPEEQPPDDRREARALHRLDRMITDALRIPGAGDLH